MALITPQMSLRVWDQLGDNYDHTQLADNWSKVDNHDHTTGKGPQIPTAGIKDGAITPNKLAAALRTITQETTWAIGGEIKVPSGDTDFIPPAFVTRATDETLTLTRLRAQINSGTSVTLSATRNGTPITGYEDLSVTSSADDIGSGTEEFDNNDVFGIVVTAVSGTPKNLTVTAVFERTR